MDDMNWPQIITKCVTIHNIKQVLITSLKQNKQHV